MSQLWSSLSVSHQNIIGRLVSVWPVLPSLPLGTPDEALLAPLQLSHTTLVTHIWASYSRPS